MATVVRQAVVLTMPLALTLALTLTLTLTRALRNTQGGCVRGHGRSRLGHPFARRPKATGAFKQRPFTRQPTVNNETVRPTGVSISEKINS